MEIDDLPEVFHLGEKLFTSQDFPNLYRSWDEWEVTGWFHSEPDYCFVAETQKKVVGFALGSIVEKPKSAWKYGHLVWLGVEEKYQRSGVASKLFKFFRENMEEQGVRMLIIDTQADNVTALNFFRKKGFSNPTEHVYLSLNLETTAKEKK